MPATVVNEPDKYKYCGNPVRLTILGGHLTAFPPYTPTQPNLTCHVMIFDPSDLVNPVAAYQAPYDTKNGRTDFDLKNALAWDPKLPQYLWSNTSFNSGIAQGFSKPYVVSFADRFGIHPETESLTTLATKWMLYGGYPVEFLTDNSVPFVAHNYNDKDLRKMVDRTQPDWVCVFHKTAVEFVNIEVIAYLSDGTTTTLNFGPVEAEAQKTYWYESGFKSLGLAALEVGDICVLSYDYNLKLGSSLFGTVKYIIDQAVHEWNTYF
ncbi:MAG: hypothetical protein ABI002_04285, partial [Saprospiraceae bacterium]